jgi:hypothetical protein
VNNSGNTPAHLTLSASGGGFTGSFGAGGSTANAGGSANGTATFTPNTPGAATGTLTIATSDVLCSAPLGPVTLTANALVPIASYSGATLTTSVTCGQGASAVLTVVVSNGGNTPLDLSNVTSQNGRLSVINVPQPIAPGLSGNITFVANAATVGTDLGGSVVSDTLLFTTNEVGSPTHSVPVQIQINGANLEYLDMSQNPITTVNMPFGCSSTFYYIANTGNMTTYVQGNSPYPGDANIDFPCETFYPFCYGGDSRLHTSSVVPASPPFYCVGAAVTPGSPVEDQVVVSTYGQACAGPDSFVFQATDQYGADNDAPVCIPLQPLNVEWSVPPNANGSCSCIGSPSCGLEEP